MVCFAVMMVRKQKRPNKKYTTAVIEVSVYKLSGELFLWNKIISKISKLFGDEILY